MSERASNNQRVRESSRPFNSLARGLTGEEAAARLRRDGYNELPSAKPRHVLRIALDVVREPMFLLLIVAAAAYIALGDLQEALLLGGSILLIIGITFYQQRRTERALEALRDLASPRALVIRGSERVRISGREVVTGDLLVLAEGDRVPADAIVHSANDLLVDESLLTGESVPVAKFAPSTASNAAAPQPDPTSHVYAGTLVVRGQGLAEVRATGARAAIGQIGAAMRELGIERTPLQHELGRLARVFAVIGLAISALVIVIYGATRGEWLSAILVGITLAMSLLPEEIPVVLTVFLALGAWRIAQHQVLTRRVPAVEVLGSATVLCVDKTGTLTMNQMAATRLYAAGRFLETASIPSGHLPDPFADLVRFAVLASEPDTLDPTERAIVTFGEQVACGPGAVPGLRLVHEYSLTPEFPAMMHGWEDISGHRFLAAKGAPEAILSLSRLDESAQATALDAASAMAAEGLRVLGVGRASNVDSLWPATQQDVDLEFLGLFGLADPVRPTVPGAIAECRSAGIRVVMMTGDYPVTASAIARQIGLEPWDELLTGADVERFGDAALQERVRSINIFARLAPTQKLRLVRALKANGEVVAMTGDGVNDAPALKAAHIGVAMGRRGTDVAREAAALVLLNDDFAAIVQAVRIGRRIVDNLRKAIAYICAIHVPIAGVALTSVVFNWPLVLLPIHVVVLELVIDPTCSMVFEAETEERDVMRRPPRNPSVPIIGADTLLISMLEGLGVLTALLTVLALAFVTGVGDLAARSAAFTTLVIGNLGLIQVSRVQGTHAVAELRRPTRSLALVIAGALLMLAVALYVPSVQSLFRFAPLPPSALVIASAAGVLGVLLVQPLTPILRRRLHSR